MFDESLAHGWEQMLVVYHAVPAIALVTRDDASSDGYR